MKCTFQPPMFGVRQAVAVVERERFRRGRDRALDDLGRKQHRGRPASVGSPRSSRRWRIFAPRMSMPVSAMIRFASASIALICPGSRIWIVGLISRRLPLTLRAGLLYDRSTMNARIHADRSATPDLRTEDDFSLPGWTYWDPEFFELERQVIFKKSWHLVCHVNDVPQSGDYPDLQVPERVDPDRSRGRRPGAQLP